MPSSSAIALSTATPPPRSTLRRIALLDIVLPVLAVVTLTHNGVAPLAAYATGSLFPASSIIVSWLRRRSVDYIGLGVLVGIASALLMAVVTGDPRFGLVRAMPASAVFGIACLVSLATRRPLMFFVARSLATGGDAARIAAWNARLVLPAFRKVMRLLTAVWGVGTLAHAVLTVSVAFLLPASVALILEPVMAVATIAALLAWTRAIQRRNPAPPL
jgi:hypothetical protein